MKKFLLLGFLASSFLFYAQDDPCSNTSTLSVTGDFNVEASGTYPMIIPPQNISGSGSGSQVFRKNVDIKLSLGSGDVFESCIVKLDLQDFDDGLQFDIDGTNLLNFQQKHWDNTFGANTTEFNGEGRFVTSGGMWTPWSGQGNPKLEISTGKVQLMVDTKNGGREDALPFMDSTVADWKLISTFTYDCLKGFNLLIGNQNGGGGPSGINAKLTVEAYVGPCNTNTSFSLQDDNNKITVGSCTCNAKNDGSLALSIEDTKYNYTISVSGVSDPIKISGTNKTDNVTGLAKGTYTVCFKVDENPDYEQCFEAVITEPISL